MNKMNMICNKFFIQGENSWFAGKKLDDNPYNDMDSENYQEWREGWRAMNKDPLRYMYRLQWLNGQKKKQQGIFGWLKRLISKI